MPAESNAVLSIDVRKSFADFALSVTSDISLDGVTGLFGASGSGKSTLLRVIAGFEKGVAGTVRMTDKVWLDSKSGEFVPAFRRQVGYVFQDARLFEHLDVAGNLRFAENRASGRGPEFAEVVAALDLHSLLDRAVTKLSGGERQRVALGRTLLCRPGLLLLDEPLAALDSARKQEILPYLETLRARFGIPTVYVSHAVDEIVRLADRVIVLQDGKI
ncbi:MAG: ATP-binding cassette domain-containing protein, partial [Woeseia sp.]